MNDDFEEYDDEEYDDEEDDGREEWDKAKEKAKEARDKFKEERGKKPDTSQSNNDPTQHNKAKDFDKSLRDKNQARTNNPGGQEVAKQGGQEVAKQAGKEAGKQATTSAATTGTAAAAGGTAATAGGTAAAAGGTAVAAGGTAAAAGGAVAVQAAIPVAGWIALAIEAAILAAIAYFKWRKKRDQKLAESGFDAKGMRRLLMVSPILLPIAIIFLVFVIIIVLIQTETYDKMTFMTQAIECFESENGCEDFMNSGRDIEGNGKKLIKATDWDLAGFVIDVVIIEERCFGSNGSSFMADIVEELNEVSKEGIFQKDEGVMDKILDLMQERFEQTFVGQVVTKTNYALHLFKWIKMEKNIFNNIQWKKAYTATRFAWASELVTWYSTQVLQHPPEILIENAKEIEPLTWSFHGLDTGWLGVPTGIKLDEAVEIAEPYIPSWMELYATYVATGNYKLVDELYDYYMRESQVYGECELEITLYQLLTVTQKQIFKGKVENIYWMDKDGDGTEYGLAKITEDEYNNYMENGVQSIWGQIGDLMDSFQSFVSNAVDDFIEALKYTFGFNVSVDAKWSAIVTKGSAWTYKIKQDYEIHTEEEEELIEGAETRETTDELDGGIKYEIYDEEAEETVTKRAWCSVTVKVNMDHYITKWTQTLKYISTSMDEYEEDNRYATVFLKIVEDNDVDEEFKYTIDDVAMAIETIEYFYGEEYTSMGVSVDYSALPEGDFGWPVPANKCVSAIFGYSQWYGSEHGGIDIWGVDSSGNFNTSVSGVVDIVAARDGTVITAFDGNCRDNFSTGDYSCGGGYGNYVEIEHDDGYKTVYAHMTKRTLGVKVGDVVRAGQYLGKMGSSGNSSGVHLHYEIQFDGNRVDPLFFYEVVPYNYSLPYNSKNRNGITMANPYKVEFDY